MSVRDKISGAVRGLSACSMAAAALMITAWILGMSFHPKEKWYDTLNQPDYETILPVSFGEWVEIDPTNSLVVSPAETAALQEVYSQVVSRTYSNRRNSRRIMLSVAYITSNQASRQMHRPEACYSSQGFEIWNLRPDTLNVALRHLSIFRMTASIQHRREQVSYWMRVGDQTVGGPPYNVSLQRMKAALDGIIADGLLFRVSEISDDPAVANQLEDQFVADLLAQMPAEKQRTLVGRPFKS
jgi:EpsI family protein